MTKIEKKLFSQVKLPLFHNFFYYIKDSNWSRIVLGSAYPEPDSDGKGNWQRECI